MKRIIILATILAIVLLTTLTKTTEVKPLANASESQLSDKIATESRMSKYEVTTDKLLQYFKIHTEMRKIIPYIVKGCKQENVSVPLLTAIAIQESGWGTSDLARNKKNYFGIRAYDWGPYKNGSDFSEYTLEEAIIRSIQIVKKDYLTHGWTIDEIGKKYCPTNPKWSKHITSIMNDLQNNT